MRFNITFAALLLAGLTAVAGCATPTKATAPEPTPATAAKEYEWPIAYAITFNGMT